MSADEKADGGASPSPANPSSPAGGSTDPKPEEISPKDGAPATAADPDAVPEGGATDFHQTATTLNNLLGGVHANTVYFGTAEGGRPPATGPIDAAEVQATLAGFCSGESLERARAVLDENNIVLLLAPPGTGRYSAALALLSGWPDITLARPIVSYIPTTTLGDLARTLEEAGKVNSGKHAGRRYLIHDIRGDGKPSAEQRFEIRRLRTVLAASGSRLVVSADPDAVARSDFGDLAVPWQPPDSTAIFDSHYERLSLALDEQDHARARSHAATLEHPGEVAAFVARVAKDGLDGAMHSQSAVDRDRVRDWFADQSRGLSDELAVAAACFLDRVPERIFERCLARLRELVQDHDTDERAPLAAPLALGRGRQAWGGNGLLGTESVGGRFAERVVAFRSRHMRTHAVEAVWNTYGYEVLQPLREWIDELAVDPSLEVRVQVAIGLAMLAERRWPEVRDSFLNPWSDGEFGHRLEAANVLLAMADSPVLAPVALETVLDWSENHGSRRASTAALALGGRLGARYPNKAFEQLWELTRRNNYVSRAAGIGLAVMLAEAESADDDGSGDGPTETTYVQTTGTARALAVLRNVRAALAWTTKRNRALERRAALSAVASMLGSSRFTADELVVAKLLRTEPDAIDIVGELFAAVLESGPHRHQGVAILRTLLIQIGDAPDSMALAHRFGAAVFNHWTPDTQQVLIPQVERELRRKPSAGSDQAQGAPRRSNLALVRDRGVRTTHGNALALSIIRSFVESTGQF